MPPSSPSNLRLSMGRAARSLAALAMAAGTAACGDDPFAIDWVAAPDTVTLYSLARPELELPSAFNFSQRSTVRIEVPGASGRWDLAVGTRGDELVFLPPGALGVESRARIAILPGQTYEEVVEAPSDTLLYSATEPVPARVGTAYVVRTDARAVFGGTCVYFGKLEPLAIDVAAGSLEFMFDASPVCNDRRVVPPDS